MELDSSKYLLSVVAPVFNEENSIHTLVEQIKTVVEKNNISVDLGYWAFCTNGVESMGNRKINTIGFGPGNEELARTAVDNKRSGSFNSTGSPVKISVAKAVNGIFKSEK